MIFRCDNFNSQAVAKGYFKQTIPRNYDPAKKATRKSPDGIVIPHSSYECMIMKPAEGTFFLFGTCFNLGRDCKGSSVFVNKPAICASGKAALLQQFFKSNCESSMGWLGTDARSAEYGPSLDKKCHTTEARSIKFHCGNKDVEMFEDLPAHKHKEINSPHHPRRANALSPRRSRRADPRSTLSLRRRCLKPRQPRPNISSRRQSKTLRSRKLQSRFLPRHYLHKACRYLHLDFRV